MLGIKMDVNDVIWEICSKLDDQDLATYIASSKRVYQICQSILDKRKEEYQQLGRHLYRLRNLLRRRGFGLEGLDLQYPLILFFFLGEPYPEQLDEDELQAFDQWYHRNKRKITDTLSKMGFSRQEIGQGLRRLERYISSEFAELGYDVDIFLR